MNFQQAQYAASYGISKQLPESTRLEISFAGRSNVGKSSLLNKLFQRKALARVSSVPGKTATINFYRVEDVDFVDLPGYGYAKVGKTEKLRWAELIEGYFHQDRNFALVVELIDMRHPATKLDVQMVDFLIESELPFLIVLTKADKLNKTERQQRLAAIGDEIPGLPEDTVVLPFSSKTDEGVDELRGILEQLVAFCAEHPELMPETDEAPEDVEQQTLDVPKNDEQPDDQEVTVEYIGFDNEE